MNANDTIASEDLSNITFITGGTKSGKSEFAEYLAKNVKKLSYVALSENKIDDVDWQEKIYLSMTKTFRMMLLMNLLGVLRLY